MKCTNCGIELGEEDVYCHVCHEEVYMVPDFDPELENSMIETLSGVAEDVMPDSSDLENTSVSMQIKNKDSLKKITKIKALTTAICMVVIIIVGFISYLFSNSFYYQFSQGQKAFLADDYEKAVIYYEKAWELDRTNNDINLQLARCYHKLEDESSVIKMYLQVLELDEYNEEAYHFLISIYAKNEDYKSINDLLDFCENEEILYVYRNYLAEEPTFSVISGNYENIIPLKLRSSTTGDIYYTLDGSDPTVDSMVYTVPIFLDSGDYTVKALFVNQYGMTSDVVSQVYTIAPQEPPAPEVNLYSGDYTEATWIEITEYEDYIIYYTVDGTVPTRSSMIYTEPILLPVGKSEFRFANYSDTGGFGKVTVRNYNYIFEESVSE